jgi:hypothetical protein
VQYLFDDTHRHLADAWESIDGNASLGLGRDGYLERRYSRKASSASPSFGFTFETILSESGGLPTLLFGAGRYFDSPEKARIAHDAQEQPDEWRLYLDGPEPWLWNDLHLTDLLKEDSIEAQAAELTVFVRKTFDELERF